MESKSNYISEWKGVLAMNCKSLRSFVSVVAVLLIAFATSWAAEDGAALYKTKCAGCHGASGEGKPGMKAPALKGTTKDASQLVDHITKGEPGSKAPHSKGISGLSEEQANAIAEFVKTLK
jgi:cytochrome c